MTRPTRRLTTACAALLLMASGSARAQTLQLGDLVAFGSTSTGLHRIDKATATATHLTSTVSAAGTGLASLGTTIMATDVYGTSFANFATGEIDPVTGAFTGISNQGGDINWHALAADQFTRVYYTSSSIASGALLRMTPSGGITQVGAGMPFMRGMAYDHGRGVLYGASGVTQASSVLYRIDPATGVATPIGPTVLALQCGLAFDDVTGTLYAINVSGLYTLDVASGAPTFVGPHGAGVLDGLAVYGAIPSPPQTLFAAPATISLAAGGTQTYTLDTGGAHAGALYLLLGTLSGTSPGQALGSVLVPLNLDGYFLFTVTSPNTFLPGSLGLLNGAGRASASLTLPQGTSPSLTGITAHHAFVILGTGRASNTVSLGLVR